MAKKALTGPSKSQLLREHGNLYLLKLKGRVGDKEISEDSLRLERLGIRFEEIVAVRQKVLDKYRRGGAANVT